MNLYSLIYISVPDAHFQPENLAQIAEEAQTFNRQNDITGLLLYSGTIFLQMLEGDFDRLNDVYARIAKDDRHRDLEVLIGAPASHRLFPNWTMGVLDISKSIRIDPKLLRDICNRAEGDTDAAAQAAIVLLEIFRFDPIETIGVTVLK